MTLKKQQFYFRKVKRYEVDYEDKTELKQGIIALCRVLKKDFFIVKTHAGDVQLSEILQSQSFAVIRDEKANHAYYYLYSVEFLQELDLEHILYMNVYFMTSEFKEPSRKNQLWKEISRQYAFKIGIDDYAMYVDLSINTDQYSKDIIRKITSADI